MIVHHYLLVANKNPDSEKPQLPFPIPRVGQATILCLEQRINSIHMIVNNLDSLKSLGSLCGKLGIQKHPKLEVHLYTSLIN